MQNFKKNMYFRDLPQRPFERVFRFVILLVFEQKPKTRPFFCKVETSQVYTHIVCALLYLPTMIWQFLAKKGDQQHLFRGLGLKWLAIPMIGVSAAFWSSSPEN